MPRLIALLLFSLVLMSSINAQPFVVIDTSDVSLLCDKVASYSGMKLNIGIANPDSSQYNLTIAIKMYSQSGTMINQYDTDLLLLNDIDVYFPSMELWGKYFFTRADTLIAVFHGVAVEGLMPGLPISSDTITYFQIDLLSNALNLPPYDTFYVDIDSLVFDHPSNPTSSGLMSFQMSEYLPNCGISIVNCPGESNFVADISNPVNYYINHDGWCGCGYCDIIFRQNDGPGTFIPGNGLYQFIPTVEDVGNTYDVEIEVGEDWCGDGSYLLSSWGICNFSVEVVPNSPPSFVDNEIKKYIKQPGEDLVISNPFIDEGPITNYYFWYYIDTVQDPDPPNFIDQETGDFHYTGTEADTATYYVYYVIQEGQFSDTVRFYIYHYNSFICGNTDHTGDINVGDLVWLVDYLFKGGLPPVTPEAGDVDCEPGILVSDLVYLVNYLFKGGNAPCEACP
ncbi:MAG: hypothetical protein ABIJ12_04605 [bacterium]